MKNLCTQCLVILTFVCFTFTPPLRAQLPGSGDGAPELSAEASRAIDKGLAYLLTVQKKDGSWDSNGEGGHAVGITSLALMAFMSKAHFPGFGQYGDQLDRGMKWLLKEARGTAGRLPGNGDVRTRARHARALRVVGDGARSGG